eukprot:506230-Rhodomonas_salina.1
MGCPVVGTDMWRAMGYLLRAPYAMSGTELAAYAAVLRFQVREPAFQGPGVGWSKQRRQFQISLGGYTKTTISLLGCSTRGSVSSLPRVWTSTVYLQYCHERRTIWPTRICCPCLVQLAYAYDLYSLGSPAVPGRVVGDPSPEASYARECTKGTTPPAVLRPPTVLRTHTAMSGTD